MNEDFIKEVAQSIHFGQPELIEKDLIIHLLLSRLAENPFFTITSYSKAALA